MKHALTALAVITILSLPLIGRAQDDAAHMVDLRLRLQPGDQYKFVISTEKAVSHWFHDEELNSSCSLTQWVTMDVLAVDPDGTVEVKLTFDRIALESASLDEACTYDSQIAVENDEDLAYPLMLFKALIGQSFRAKLSPRGEVLTVQETDAIKTALSDALPRDDEGRFRPSLHGPVAVMPTFLGPVMGLDPLKLTRPASLQHLVTSFFFLCPGEPVTVGDAWTRKGDILLDPFVSCDSTSKLLARQDGVATIQSEGTLKHDATTKSDKIGTIMTSNTSSEFEGTRNATMKVDEASGTIIGAHIVDALKGEVRIAAQSASHDKSDDEDNAGMPLPTTIDIITNVKGQKVKQTPPEAEPDAEESGQ